MVLREHDDRATTRVRPLGHFNRSTIEIDAARRVGRTEVEAHHEHETGIYDRSVNASPPLVRLEIDDQGVAGVTLDDADHRNALSRAMSDELAAAVETALGADVGAIVLTANPPVFCAGGALEDLERPDLDLRAAYAGFLA